MSEIEIIPDGGRRRRWSAADKLQIVEETMYDGKSICAVARRNGVAPVIQPLPHNPRKQRKNPAAARPGERLRKGKWRSGW